MCFLTNYLPQSTTFPIIQKDKNEKESQDDDKQPKEITTVDATQQIFHSGQFIVSKDTSNNSMIILEVYEDDIRAVRKESLHHIECKVKKSQATIIRNPFLSQMIIIAKYLTDDLHPISEIVMHLQHQFFLEA